MIGDSKVVLSPLLLAPEELPELDETDEPLELEVPMPDDDSLVLLLALLLPLALLPLLLPLLSLLLPSESGIVPESDRGDEEDDVARGFDLLSDGTIASEEDESLASDNAPSDESSCQNWWVMRNECFAAQPHFPLTSLQESKTCAPGISSVR